jgi:hypothetical protein
MPVPASRPGYLRTQAALSGSPAARFPATITTSGPHRRSQLTQANSSWTACSATSSQCSIAVKSTGVGHAGVLTLVANPGVYITSVSTDGSWTVPTGCQTSLSTGSTGAVSCAYNLALTGGVTTETVTLNSSSPNTYCYLVLYELSSTGTFSLDSTGDHGHDIVYLAFWGAVTPVRATSPFKPSGLLSGTRLPSRLLTSRMERATTQLLAGWLIQSRPYQARFLC